MKTIKVSEASGPVLDWMVAKCEGHVENGVYGEPVLLDGQLHIHYCGVVLDNVWCPSTGWSQGGPIIEREKISLRQWGNEPEQVTAYMPLGDKEHSPWYHGPTPLIAAMRCYCASRLGEIVEVPDELA